MPKNWHARKVKFETILKTQNLNGQCKKFKIKIYETHH